MFRRILVPVDFSQKNKRAIDVAVKIAASYNATIYLLHVVEMLADTTLDEFKDLYVKLEHQAEKKMNTMIRPYKKREINIEGHVVLGNRVQGILKFVNDNKIGLIIMSSHKIDLQEPVQDWGTISYKVGILSPSPVMLVK